MPLMRCAIKARPWCVSCQVMTAKPTNSIATASWCTKAPSGKSNPFTPDYFPFHEYFPRSQCGCCRNPMGRRRQRQTGGLADRVGARRGSVPRRAQRRPHPGDQRGQNSAALDPQRHHATRRRLLHRQWRGSVDEQVAGRDRGLRGGWRVGAFALAHQRSLPLDTALPRRHRRGP